MIALLIALAVLGVALTFSVALNIGFVLLTNQQRDQIAVEKARGDLYHALINERTTT